MFKCVLCGIRNNKKKSVTLHRFPRDEQLQKEWLKLIGLEKLNIRKSTSLCSDHFREDCLVKDFCNRTCLKPGSVPTVLKKEARFQKQQGVLLEKNCTVVSVSDEAQDVVTISEKENCEPRRNILIEINSTNNDAGPASIIEQVPEANTIVEYIDSPTTSKDIPKKTDALKKKSQCKTIHEVVSHDHHYADTPRSMKRKLNSLRRKLDTAAKENRILKQTVRRLKTKVNSLQDVVKELKHKKLLSDSAYYCLSDHEDISMELFNRMIKNRKNRGKLTRDKYINLNNGIKNYF